jgi:phosphoribosylformimino-5-aminoimidazole carboxamide ribotide isomerase
MSQPIELIPVLDLANGVAVHASGGDRTRYAPVRSRLAPGADGDALTLARAYRSLPGVRRCYVADLDAIAGGDPQRALLVRLRSEQGFGAPLLLDAGTATLAEWVELAQPEAGAVVGLETLRSFESLAELAAQVHVTFSLDLRAGKPQVSRLVAEAGSDDPRTLARAAVEAGAGALLLLDVMRVGSSTGVDLELLTSLRRSFPGVQLLVGGGVSAMTEIDDLSGAGCDGVLVATALHQGGISASTLAPRTQSSANAVR